MSSHHRSAVPPRHGQQPKRRGAGRRVAIGLPLALALGIVAFWLRPFWPVDPFYSASPPPSPCRVAGEETLRQIVPDAEFTFNLTDHTPDSFTDGCTMEVEDEAVGRYVNVHVVVQRPIASNPVRSAKSFFDDTGCAPSLGLDEKVIGRFDPDDFGDEACGVIARRTDKPKDKGEYSISVDVRLGRDVVSVSYNEFPVDEETAKRTGVDLARVITDAMKRA
jgi:hypothetical protein